MEKIVTYRHNVMQINSIDTFLGIKGGYNHAYRDVYFVRALGENQGLADTVCQADKRMGIEMSKNKLWYVRLQSLPQLCKAEDVSFYSGAYDVWKQGGKINLRHMMSPGILQNVISAGLAEVLAKHRTYGTWNERSCMKIIAEDVTKEQEYLFFYFMTLLGCDVLLLENRKDAEIPQGLKSLSQQLLLGQFGTGKLPEYKPYTLKTERDAAKDSPANTGQDAKEGRRSNVRVTIPERNRHRNQVDTNIIQSAPQRTVVDSQPQQTPAASTVSQLRAGTVSAKQESSEKTFEELAQLASSIVMIAVHDSRQEVIGTGSGIMIGRAGFILTNDHVVSGGSFFSVRMEDDGQIYTTDEVIKYNYNLDLAVIRISKQLNPLPIYSGTRKLVRGQKVVAIGSPLGLFNSVSDGIISGFRDIRDVNMIQFTAPISPGSSGGAVLNMQGEVIGISTAGIDNGQNINLAVSYKDIRTFARGFY